MRAPCTGCCPLALPVLSQPPERCGLHGLRILFVYGRVCLGQACVWARMPEGSGVCASGDQHRRTNSHSRLLCALTVRPNWGDTMEERYLEMRQVVQTNAILSVGLSLFHAPSSAGRESRKGAHLESTGTLVARPYNFLVFPGIFFFFLFLCLGLSLGARSLCTSQLVVCVTL